MYLVLLPCLLDTKSKYLYAVQVQGADAHDPFLGESIMFLQRYSVLGPRAKQEMVRRKAPEVVLAALEVEGPTYDHYSLYATLLNLKFYLQNPEQMEVRFSVHIVTWLNCLTCRSMKANPLISDPLPAAPPLRHCSCTRQRGRALLCLSLPRAVLLHRC